ncbi:MAG: Na+/H+ antiporter subunit B [Verrucomicrobiota bacterium]
MTSIILSAASRFLFVPLIIISLIVLYRGHNLPGGGFIGGLIASSAFVLVMLADGTKAARQALKVTPVSLIAAGLLVAISSGILAIAVGQMFMKGLWLPGFAVPLLGNVHLGTPLLFDIGVYLAVLGFSLGVIFELEESD